MARTRKQFRIGKMRLRALGFLMAGSLLAPAAGAWTPASQLAIAETAARLAPPDLARQIRRHPKAYREGVLSAFADKDGAWHVKHADGSGLLDRVAVSEAERAASLIRAHRPFAEVVRQLGRASHYVADAANPLNAAHEDREEARYFADYLRYVDSARPRFALVYYGSAGPPAAGVDRLVGRALARGRTLYPLVGLEYRRVGLDSGAAGFDDRSTAFAVAAVSFSHALSDVAEMLRQVWVDAGGADGSAGALAAAEPLVLLPAGGGGR
jgi:hypothetical protein